MHVDCHTCIHVHKIWTLVINDKHIVRLGQVVTGLLPCNWLSLVDKDVLSILQIVAKLLGNTVCVSSLSFAQRYNVSFIYLFIYFFSVRLSAFGIVMLRFFY